MSWFGFGGDAAAPSNEESPPTAAPTFTGGEAAAVGSRDWECTACTYLHAGPEAGFLNCAMCGTIRADASIITSEESHTEPHGVSDDAALINAATILAASRAVDNALAKQPNRDAQVLSLMATEGSMASRIAQARQARQAMRAAAAASTAKSPSPAKPGPAGEAVTSPPPVSIAGAEAPGEASRGVADHAPAA